MGTRITLLLLCAFAALRPVFAFDPVRYDNVRLVRCIDGDTCIFNLPFADPFLGKLVLAERKVRFAGIDTPETWRPACNAEAELGERARAHLLSILRAALRIDVVIVAPGKFSPIARVYADGADVSALMLEHREFTAPYNGRTHRPEWC